MWLTQDLQDDLRERDPEQQTDMRRPRSSNVEAENAPPAQSTSTSPTPRARQSSLPDLLKRYARAISGRQTVEEVEERAGRIAGEEERERLGLAESGRQRSRGRGRETRRGGQRSEEDASEVGDTVSAEGSGGRGIELPVTTRRRSRSQNDERTLERMAADKRAEHLLLRRVEREQPQGDDGGVSLKPLTPITPLPSSSSSSSAPSSEQQQQQRTKRPAPTLRRTASIAELAAEQINKLHKEELEWMTDDPIIRGYAEGSQEDLYSGFGIDDIMHTPMLTRYAEPNRDSEEINAAIYNMTVHDQDYGIGGPPDPVDIYNIDYLSDVSKVQGYAEFQHAREAKAFAGYAMFTQRQEEIDILQGLQAHGLLREGVDIQYGYQVVGPQGSITWLTYEGQKIGGRQREEYEREKAAEGKLKIFLLVLVTIKAK